MSFRTPNVYANFGLVLVVSGERVDGERKYHGWIVLDATGRVQREISQGTGASYEDAKLEGFKCMSVELSKTQPHVWQTYSSIHGLELIMVAKLTDAGEFQWMIHDSQGNKLHKGVAHTMHEAQVAAYAIGKTLCPNCSSHEIKVPARSEEPAMRVEQVPVISDELRRKLN